MNAYKATIENLGADKTLYFSHKEMGEDDMKSLAEALSNSQVTELSLAYSKIECNGLKHLADVLKDTQIKRLNLLNNNLRDEGVKYLADVLIDTKIEELDLTHNRIGFEIAAYLNELVKRTAVKKLYLEVYYAENSNNCVSQRSNCKFDDVCLKLEGSDIGSAGANYINKSFREKGIKTVEFSFESLNYYHLDYFFQAFKNIKISKLQLSRSDNVRYLIQIFQKSRIGELSLYNSKLNGRNIGYLAQFLKKIRILDLSVGANLLNDNCMRTLAPALKNSDIVNLDLGKTKLTFQGIEYLSEILRDSKIVSIDLCNSRIGTEGAKKLANGLPRSQVTDMHLHGNEIEDAGYQALINVVESTNISWVNLHCNGIEAGLNGERVPDKIPRNTVTIAFQMENAFKGLVSYNSSENEFEFVVPKKDCDPPVNIDQYAFLIGTLKNDPNSKVHIIRNMRRNGDGVYEFDAINKIEDFVTNVTNKFLSFVESKIPDLLDVFAADNYVDLVKQFEELKLRDIVENLLLHRILYYVDENQEILHPYIYKLLNRYNLPLYNSELEPNKKNEIISYYENHQDIEGAQEIVDLLKSNFL